MKAIISDLHSNIEALQAVYDDIDRLGIKEIFCLGDIVGYGPDPIKCLQMVHKKNGPGNSEAVLYQVQKLF